MSLVDHIDKLGFMKIDITPEMIHIANKKSDEMGVLKNSITNGEGNVAAFIGEEVSRIALDAVSNNTFQHDLIADGNIRIEVKTKRRKSDPLLHFNATVAKHNTTQKADFYCFATVKMDINGGYEYGHMVGIITREDFFKKADFFYKGDLEPDSNPPFRFREDSYNIKLRHLHRFKPD